MGVYVPGCCSGVNEEYPSNNTPEGNDIMYSISPERYDLLCRIENEIKKHDDYKSAYERPLWELYQHNSSENDRLRKEIIELKAMLRTSENRLAKFMTGIE